MKSWPLILMLGAIFPLCGIVSPSATAKTAGNCLECHSQKFAFNDSTNFYLSADIENRRVFQARLNPCPGVRSLTEETYYTESRLITLNRMTASLDQEGTATNIWRLKVAETSETFSNMKDAGASLSQFAKGTAFLRTGLQKIYDQAFRARAEADHRWLIGVGGGIFIVILVFVGIGYRKLNQFSKNVFLLALLVGSFSLNACSQNGLDPKAKSPAQERLDQAQVVAVKLAAKAEDSFSSAILLAGLAKDWTKIDPANAEKAFHLSWQMALKAREDGGQMAPLKRVAEQWPNPVEAARQRVNFDAVLDLRDELKGLEARTWALRAVAEEWYKANPKRGREALESAYREAQGIKNGEIRDIELKAMAEAWTGIDEKRALEAANCIQDPFLKSIGFAAVAKSLQEKEKAGELLREAWNLAETVSPATLKIYAFSKISAAAAGTLPQKKGEWARRVHAKVKELQDPLLQVFAYQELVSSWASSDWEQAERWADEITANQAEAKTFSLIYVGRSKGIPKEKTPAVLKKALAEADRIEDTFQAQKARTLILLKLASLDPQEAMKALPKIEDPILRSEVEAELVGQIGARDENGALEIAGNIPSEFERWKAILKVLNRKLPSEVDQLSAIYQGAMQAATTIADPYSRAFFLVELGKNWGRVDKTKESAVYDLALKTAGEISSPSLRAEAWETLAAAWKNSNKTKAQSIIESIDANVLRARKVVEEVKLWSKIDLEKAKQMTEAIPAAFAYEKAQAYKEIAVNIKKSQPNQAIEPLEKAWQLVYAIPEGGSRDKILSSILIEMASQNCDKALAMVQTLADRRIKDELLREAGSALLKEDSPKAISGAMKIANEISESSLRTSLYQRIADLTGKGIKSGETNQPIMIALTLWGQGRETAKKEETKAAPCFENAFQEISKISDVRERTFILPGFIDDWTQIDEAKALKAAEKISPEFAERLSYSLMQVGAQFRKWNRKEAEAVFQKAVTAAQLIQDPSLRSQRLVQIARQWQLINKEKGREVLKKAEGVPSKPYQRAKAILDSGKEIYKETIEKDLKLLEKAFQFAQGNKNPRILTEIALAWSWIEVAKAQEIAVLIDSKEARVKALRSMARQAAKTKPEMSRGFLEKAVQEASALEGLKERIPALRGIAGDWANVDSGKAKATYLLAYQAAERIDQISPKF